MSKKQVYCLGTWEENGYHDSYFKAVQWNDEKGEIRVIETGATAYSGGCSEGAYPTPEIVEKARKVYAKKLFDAIKAQYAREVFEPENVREGEKVQLLKTHKNQIKQLEDCRKCEGSGKWVNPNNERDVRNCFGCRGTGKRKSRKTLKDKNGKTRYIHIPEGTVGTVVSCKAYGTFYRNGYNQPNRYNRSCIVRLDDGAEVRVPLEKMRLAKSMPSDEDLLEKAEKMSHDLHFARFVPRFAWYTRHHAREVVNKKNS